MKTALNVNLKYQNELDVGGLKILVFLFTILFSIWYRNNSIAFKEGKNAIELSSKVELEPTLKNIKKAADNGELDWLLKSS